MTVRRVNTGTDFTRGDSQAHLDKGTFIQVEPSSVLETAIGVASLDALADPPAAAVHAGAGN
jgi:hypothetical protein